jgi:hypothetical protein
VKVRCQERATHKLLDPDSTKQKLVCEPCAINHNGGLRFRKRIKNWTQTIADKQCECEHIQDG